MRAIPKPLLNVKGKPVLSYVVEFWKDRVDSYIFIVQRQAISYLAEYLPRNCAVIFQDEPKGLADAILRAEPYVRDTCVIALADCLQAGEFDFPNGVPVPGPGGKGLRPGLSVGVWETDNEYEIFKSYSVELLDGAVINLKEKPKVNETGLCGMGTYFMDRRVFRHIREALPDLKPGGGDFTDVLQRMADAGEEIRPNFFRGQYINVNSPQDLVVADYMIK